MINLILSQQVYWFSALFLLVAIATRKDLAIIAAAVSIAGALLWHENLPRNDTFTGFCALNGLLAIIASWYIKISATNLSKVVAILASGASALNLIQLYDITSVSYYMLTGLGWALLLALVFMDGRKGLLNGLYTDMRDSILRHVHLFSRLFNDKGS